MQEMLFVGVFVLTPVFASADTKTPSYVRDVKPILTSYCVRCHQPSRAKGGLDLTTVEAMQKMGRRGKIMMEPGKSAHSRVVQTMEGRRPAMPPRRSKKPTEKEIAVIRDWINAGAKDDSPKKD
jgi:hypothetical protein